MCLQNNKAYAQDGGDDKTKSIILNKYLTPTEDPSKFKITLSSFVHSDEQPVKQSLDIALVLDYSSSMWTPDGVDTEVATGATLNWLCSDMNWTKNQSKTPNPFFNQQRKIKIGGVTYDLMQYTRKKGDRTSTMAVAHDLSSLPKNADNKWYYWADNKWIEYKDNNANDVVYSQARIDILRSASVKFIEALSASASSWLTINVSICKFCMTEVHTSMLDVSTNKQTLINYIVNDVDKFSAGVIAEGTHYYNAVQNVIPLFKTQCSDIHRNIVVFFSDGVPYDGGDQTKRNTNANNTIKYLHDNFKYNNNIFQTNNYVYSVGLLNGPADEWSQLKIENLLRAISSDYPDAVTQMAEKQPTKEDKYYSLADPDKLAKIFEDIAHSATADMYPLTDNNSSAVDIMSNSFSLPEGFTAADVTVHTETCIGIADGYDPDNLSDKSFNWTTSIVNGQYYEDEDHQPKIAVDQQTQKIVVTNYNYSLKDNTAPATNVKGNWVGGRLYLDSKGEPQKDASGNFVYTYAGKRLVVEFTVNYNGEPGFNIPSNDTRCGIYPNTTGTGDPIKEYNRPMADFPALIIVKEGLKAGESSIFKVSAGDKVICSLVLTGTGEVYKAGDMAVNKGFYNAGDAVPAIGIVRDLDYGDYTVEELPWSWAYNMTSYHTGGTTVTQTLKKEGIPTEEQAVAAWIAASASGKFTGTAYYVINDGITLAYRFKNTPKTSQPLHGESDALNEMPVGDEGGTGDEEEI